MFVKETKVKRSGREYSYLQLVEGYRDRHNLPLTHPRVALMDLQYHDVNRQRGLYYRMQDRGLVERAVTDENIDRAVIEPPQTKFAYRQIKACRHIPAVFF